jgi:CheY-like chemotaxis protein
VLLIDDDPDLLELTRLELGEDGDIAIQTCSSPAGALKLVEKQRFDSIVCDYYMPEMNGCSLMELLRSRGCTAQLILYSGKSPGDEMGPDQEIAAQESCMDACVQRRGEPAAEFRELKQVIRDAFAKKEK